MRPNCDDLADKFRRKVRLSTTDGDGAVAKAERGNLYAHVDRDLLHIDCRVVHRVPGFRKYTMLVMSSAVTALIRVALSLRFGNCIAHFRDEFRKLTGEILVYERGAPMPEHRASRAAIPDLYCPGRDRPSKLRRAIVEVLLTGDPFSHRLVHRCSGCCSGEADCRVKFQVYLTAALVGHTPRPFDRSRWTDQEHSLRWVGLLEANHRLFSRTYERFAQRLSRKRRQEGPARGKAAERAGRAIADRDADEFGAEAAAQAPAAEGGGGGAEEDWGVGKRLDQSKYRATVQEWISDLGPSADLAILEHSVEIMRKYTQRLLKLGGSQWEEDQSLTAMGVQQGAGQSPQRQYRVVIVALGELELDAIYMIKKPLGAAECWHALPAAARTVAARVAAFRVLSRMLSLVGKQLSKNCTYPYKTFMLLVDIGMKDIILSERCQWDSWTKSFCTAFAGPGIDSREALLELQCSATMLKVDTSQIEAWHAAVRRVCMLRGTQTHAESFLDASAGSILRKARLHRDRVSPKLEGMFGPRTPAAQPGGTSAESKAPRGGGGPWRAFVALNAGTEGADLQHLGRLYDQLDDEEKERLIAIGAEATLLHRQGVAQPFGPTKRQQEREQQAMLMRNACDAMLEDRARELDQSLVLAFAAADRLVVAQRQAPGGGAAWSRVLAIRALCAVEERVRAAAGRRRESAIASFEANGGLLSRTR